MDCLSSILSKHKLLFLTKDHKQMFQRIQHKIFIWYFSVEIPAFLDNPLVLIVKDLIETWNKSSYSIQLYLFLSPNRNSSLN